MKKSILLAVFMLILIYACSPPAMPTPDPTTLVPPTTTATIIPTSTDNPPPTTTILSGAPTVEPTLEILQLAVYPPETRTTNPELDLIIDALLGHDFSTLKELTSYLQTGCTWADGLGGPPKCEKGEIEGTILEVVPFLGPEGHHSRRSDYDSWEGPDVLGLLAAYATSSGTYHDEIYPAGEFALVFLLAGGPEAITLQVTDGRIIRYDYHFGGQTEGNLLTKAEDILLPLNFNPVPTAVPWNLFSDPENRFSFIYPPTLDLVKYDPQGNWQLGNRIRIEVLSFENSWISCFYKSLGDCPFVETDQRVEINGVDVRRIEGYIGSVGGNTPQDFLVYIFHLEDKVLVFSIFALPFGIQTSDPSVIWPLEGIDLDLFERTVQTVIIE
jgi:hypothetical protein